MDEEREVSVESVSSVERIEVIICFYCKGNGKNFPHQDPEDVRDIDPIICSKCGGTGKLVRNTRTQLFPHRGYVVDRTITHKDFYD